MRTVGCQIFTSEIWWVSVSFSRTISEKNAINRISRRPVAPFIPTPKIFQEAPLFLLSRFFFPFLKSAIILDGVWGVYHFYWCACFFGGKSNGSRSTLTCWKQTLFFFQGRGSTGWTMGTDGCLEKAFGITKRSGATEILLMEEIRLTSWGWQFIPFFRFLYTPSGCLGFLPSTVSLKRINIQMSFCQAHWGIWPVWYLCSSCFSVLRGIVLKERWFEFKHIFQHAQGLKEVGLLVAQFDRSCLIFLPSADS